MSGVKRIIFTGKKGHGKDTAAAALSGWLTLKFADPLKNMLRQLLRDQSVDEIMIERMIEGDLKETPSIYFNGKTPRWAQQSLGTEWGRDLISPELWTDIWKRRTDRIAQSKTTDMRFPNENEAAWNVRGFTIRVFNPRVPDNSASEHPSETQVMSLKVHADIKNDGSIADLHEKVLAATFDYRTT